MPTIARVRCPEGQEHLMTSTPGYAHRGFIEIDGELWVVCHHKRSDQTFKMAPTAKDADAMAGCYSNAYRHFKVGITSAPRARTRPSVRLRPCLV